MPGYTSVSGVALAASTYCARPGETIRFYANLSGAGTETVRVSIKANEVEIASCDALPNDRCETPYTVPTTEGAITVQAKAQGTRGDAKTSAPVTTINVQKKLWRAEPELIAGRLVPKRQTPGQQTPPAPAEPPAGAEPPAPTPPFVVPTGGRRFAPGSTVRVSVAQASDRDTCSLCGIDQTPASDDVIKYGWTQGGTGTQDAITVTMPTTQGQSIDVAVNVDDEATLNGDAGTRDDAAVALTMKLYAAYPDPSDPDPDDDGLPNSMDDDDDGDGVPDADDPTPRPDPTPVPTATPSPQSIPLTATAQTWSVTNGNSIKVQWTGAAGTLYRSLVPDFAPSEATHISRGANENDSSKTTFTDNNLEPETTYHYILVPNGNLNMTQGNASATTTKAPKVTIEQSVEPATAIISQPVEARLHATFDPPDGVVVEDGPVWTWELVSVKFTSTEPQTAADWDGGEVGGHSVALGSNGSGIANQYWTFYSVGFYQVKVKAIAHVTINGQVKDFEAIQAVGH